MDAPTSRQIEAMVDLMAHLFHKKFWPEFSERVAKEQPGPLSKIRVPMPGFYEWCIGTLSFLDAEDVCAAADVSTEAWENVRAILESPGAAKFINDAWWFIVLADRPPSAVRLSSINVNVTLTYEDGVIANHQVFVPVSILPGAVSESGFTDAMTVSALAVNFHEILHTIASRGLDKSHDMSRSIVYKAPAGVPEDPYEVFMGLVLKGLPQIKPELQEGVRNYMRLAQGAIRPVIPQGAAEAARIANEQRERSRMASEPRKDQGGWQG